MREFVAVMERAGIHPDDMVAQAPVPDVCGDDHVVGRRVGDVIPGHGVAWAHECHGAVPMRQHTGIDGLSGIQRDGKPLAVGAHPDAEHTDEKYRQ